jgi:hypothetical protein
MPVIPAFIPYERFFLSLRYPKLILISLVLIALMIPLLLLPAYQESWFDPFNTLSVPNKVLHPLSFSQIGLMNPADPFNPHFFADRKKVKELMKALQHATLISSDQTQVLSKDEEILYFTLHREANRFHDTADLALQYYPQRNIVCFAQQQYKIDNMTILLLNDISQKMQAGWWYSKKA